MKKKIEQVIEIPVGITCSYNAGILTCKKDRLELSKKIDSPEIEIKVENSRIVLTCNKGNKNQNKKIMTIIAHIENIFKGLHEKFTYRLEVVHVHFPMALKVEGERLTISNFFGEKIPRHAKILPNVNVEIRSHTITISSLDKEAAGQTAANFEKATKVKGKDSRIYQDGIYIVEKPRREL